MTPATILLSLIAIFNPTDNTLTLPAVKAADGVYFSGRYKCDATGDNCKLINVDRICNGFSPQAEVCNVL